MVLSTSYSSVSEDRTLIPTKNSTSNNLIQNDLTQTPKSTDLPRPLETFTRGLLATTCLTAACGASAMAGTIVEGTTPAPADFPNTLPAFALPTGTTAVTGFIGGDFTERGSADPADWFEFTGLTVGVQYTITGQSDGADPFRTGFGENGVQAFYFNSSSLQLGFLDLGENGGNSLSQVFTAPGDGNLIVELAFRTTGCGEDGCPIAEFEANPAPYSISLSTGTPEPATIGGVGLGLGAIALAWRRRRAG
jgi:hypothetical protein